MSPARPGRKAAGMPRRTRAAAGFRLRPRKAVVEAVRPDKLPDLSFWDDFDLAYRILVGVLFNYVPTSGHPGGSISSGRLAAGLVLDAMDYDFSDPNRACSDVICYAAGHKAMGLYALWALRNELVRIADPALLPEERRQLRLEDLVGFRRNPTQPTPLFRQLRAKALDGHPTPATPFVPLATGASGVGIPGCLGLALGARDAYGPAAPRVHAVEGEGGMTPGRVHEALAAAASMGLDNLFIHLDWNQASIDSEAVCAEGDKPGDYVQWDPIELFALHGWNVVEAGDGRDIRRVLAAQRAALKLRTGQPTAVVYRTVKGWQYGIEGRKSHGAGHPFCSENFYATLAPFERRFKAALPRLQGEKTPERLEAVYYGTLLAMRSALETDGALAKAAAAKVRAARQRLEAARRAPRDDGPRLERLYEAGLKPEAPPAELQLKPGQATTLRGALGQALGHINRLTNGAVLGSAADLLESTSVSAINEGFPKGFFHAGRNPGSRLVAVGGICEDAMGAAMAGLSAYGRHIGVTSSYAAFIAALEHIPARLHLIGQQARQLQENAPYRAWIMINAHVGPKTGEDGPTHADPQALQVLQENFPRGGLITLVPWEPSEVWPLLIAGLMARPGVLAPYVTRPSETVPDRAVLGLPPAHAAVRGLYALRCADTDATVVLQGSGVALAFVRDVLPRIVKEGVEINVFYAASAELFDLLPEDERERLYPERLARAAIGVTDFTLPTLMRWVRSDEGLRRSLHAFRGGHFLGSGQGDRVLAEGGLDAESQFRAVRDWCRLLESRAGCGIAAGDAAAGRLSHPS